MVDATDSMIRRPILNETWLWAWLEGFLVKVRSPKITDEGHRGDDFRLALCRRGHDNLFTRTISRRLNGKVVRPYMNNTSRHTLATNRHSPLPGERCTITETIMVGRAVRAIPCVKRKGGWSRGLVRRFRTRKCHLMSVARIYDGRSVAIVMTYATGTNAEGTVRTTD